MNRSTTQRMRQGAESGLPAGEAPGEPQRSSALRHVFIGRDGLRAGWSLLIFIAILAPLLVGANVLGHRLHLLPLPRRLEPFTPTFTIIRGIDSVPSDRPCDLDHVADRAPLQLGLRSRRSPQALALSKRTRLGSGVSLASCDDPVEGGISRDRRTAALRQRGHSLWAALAARVSRGRPAGGVPDARLSALYADARPCGNLSIRLQDAPQRGDGLLDGSHSPVDPLRPRPRLQPRRVPHRSPLRGPRLAGLLPEPLAHRLALVGHRLPCCVGLGPVVPLRSRRQRDRHSVPPALDASRRQAAAERRNDRAGGQRLRPADPGVDRAIILLTLPRRVYGTSALPLEVSDERS